MVHSSVIDSEGDYYYRKDISVGNDGVVHAAYNVADSEYIHLIKYSAFNGSAWTSPEIVSIGINGYGKTPTVNVSSEGYPQFVWYENSPDVAQIYYKQKTDYGCPARSV